MDRSLPVVLDDLLSRDVSLPVCPIIFIRLTEALEHSDDRNLDLASTLSADTALTSQVLRVANSVMYGLVRQVRSIDEAVMRLGFIEVWTIAAALKAKELYCISRPEWTELSNNLWRHALQTATLVKCLGKRAYSENISELFTAGILHDIGKLVLHQVSPQYALLAENGALRGNALILREQDFFGTHHGRVGGELLKRWNLPDTLVALVAGHHDGVPEGGELSREQALLWLANDMAYAPSPAEQMPKLVLPQAALAATGLGEAQCWDLALEAQQQLALLQSLQG
jgi:putative nucleotidyltransferase with HDIG domain